MLRLTLSSVFLVAGFLGFAEAENQNTNGATRVDKTAKEGKISKLDAKAGTATVKFKSDGKEVEKTFKLAKDVLYTDCMGKETNADMFLTGDLVLFVENDGQISKLKKHGKEATITKLDGGGKTATVKTRQEGKDVEKTFKLADEIEYMDSTGKVANVEIFTSGDLVLYVESEGQITKLKKCEKPEVSVKPKGDK
jgi:hypothetical protein